MRYRYSGDYPRHFDANGTITPCLLEPGDEVDAPEDLYADWLTPVDAPAEEPVESETEPTETPEASNPSEV